MYIKMIILIFIARNLNNGRGILIDFILMAIRDAETWHILHTYTLQHILFISGRLQTVKSSGTGTGRM